MVAAAQRHRELIADLVAELSALSEAQGCGSVGLRSQTRQGAGQQIGHARGPELGSARRILVVLKIPASVVPQRLNSAEARGKRDST